MGTGVAFLEFIINWANNRYNLASESGLVLFRQAGMGKSSIAHVIIYLPSKGTIRTEGPTTFVRDLTDCYTSKGHTGKHCSLSRHP
jgi:hypothetical protein